MDTLADNEVKSIWKRVKRYINPENIKARTREELAREIEKQMTLAGKSGKQGSMDSLVKNGFADRISRFEEVREEFEQPVTPEGEKLKTRAVKRAKRESPNSQRLRYNSKRVTIQTSKGFRSYKPENVKVTISTYRGRSAYYVSNVRTGKRISRGFVE